MRVVLSVLLPILLAFPLVSPADDPPHFSSGVTLVRVDAQVSDLEGRPITGLKQSDFRVFDEGNDEALVSFAAEEQPLDVVLLVDVSSSMRRAVQRFADVGPGAIAELRPGDRVAVMTFATDPHLLGPFTDNLSSVRDTLNQLRKARIYGRTHIYDGIYEAANLFLALHDDQSLRRRAVIIFTDNVGRGGRKVDTAVENLWEANATLIGMIVQIHRLAGDLPLSMHGGIERPAFMTGGEMMRAADVDAVFPEALRKLRSRYGLYYRLPEGAAESVRSIRVELSGDARRRYPAAEIRARQGYRLRAGEEKKGLTVRQ